MISVPFFKTNGLEDLAVADIYKLTDAVPVNKVFEAAKDLSSKLYDQVGGRDGLIRSVTSLVSLKNQGATGAELITRGMQMLGTSQQSLLRTVGGAVLDKAGTFVDLDPSVINKIKVIAGDSSRYMNVKDPNNLSSVFGILGGLSDNPNYLKMVNVGMEASVWGSAVSQAVQYNTYEVFDHVKKNTDPETFKWSMIYASSTIMSQGDLDTLIKMMETLTVDEILGNNPDFIRVFLSAFKVGEGDAWTPEHYPEKAQLLYATMNKLNPLWCKFQRNSETIINLSPLITLSKDAKRLLGLIPELKKPIQMAPSFPPTSTYAVCRALYPLSVASLK